MRRPRTAVIIVHGMGEQLPVETLNRFVRAALPKVGNDRNYYSRPERITESYEARRHLAPRMTDDGGLVHGQTEFFEYHWSYLMTGNKLNDLLPTLRRLLLQKPDKVPYGLKRVWLLIWALLVLLALGLVAILVAGITIEEFTIAGVVAAVLGEGVLAWLLLQLLNRAGNVVTKSFVDVVRYLDKSPRSYEVRRAIRKGMIDLLRGLHDKQRYSRVVVVAHSLGAYIAYDALSYLWPTMCKLHSGPPPTGPDPAAPGQPQLLAGLPALERCAQAVLTHPVDQSELDATQVAELRQFTEAQFDLWKELRCQGNPWLITDLVTVGTPMYFADQLYTRNRDEFDQLSKRAELPVCPPRSATQKVEGPDAPQRRYGWINQGRQVLAHGAPFAVTRWTNLYFPAEESWRGDWFGGPLRPLFGTGITDIAITGDLPRRRAPALAHVRYFDVDDTVPAAPNDAVTILRRTLRLDIDDELEPLLNAPRPDPNTDKTA